MRVVKSGVCMAQGMPHFYNCLKKVLRWGNYYLTRHLCSKCSSSSYLEVLRVEGKPSREGTGSCLPRPKSPVGVGGEVWKLLRAILGP